MAENSEAATADEKRQPPLRRVIGPKLLLFFIVGDVIGTGIYALTGTVAGKIGGALWLPFLIAFGVAFLIALSYLELVGKYPQAAGAALYTHKAFGIPMLTFMVAFAVMSSGITSASSAAVAFAKTYLAELMGGNLIAPAAVIASAFILVLGAINFRGVSESVKLNVVLTCIELSGLFIIVVIGAYAIAVGNGEPSRLTQVDTAHETWLTAVGSATALAFFAMVGFEDSVNMAEETHDPVRTFPKAMLWGMAIAAAIYVLVSVTSSLLIPADRLAKAESNALLLVVSVGAPSFPRWVFALIGLFAVINSALINMLMASRLVYGMANERIIPRIFGTVHASRRTPWVSILFTSAIAITLVSTVDIGILGGTTALLLLAVFTIVNVAVLVLRKHPVEHQHFRAPTAVPVVGAVSCAYLASPLSGREPSEYVIAGILLAVGLVLWAINRRIVGRVTIHPERLSKSA